MKSGEWRERRRIWCRSSMPQVLRCMYNDTIDCHTWCACFSLVSCSVWQVWHSRLDPEYSIGDSLCIWRRRGITNLFFDHSIQAWVYSVYRIKMYTKNSWTMKLTWRLQMLAIISALLMIKWYDHPRRVVFPFSSGQFSRVRWWLTTAFQNWREVIRKMHC